MTGIEIASPSLSNHNTLQSLEVKWSRDQFTSAVLGMGAAEVGAGVAVKNLAATAATFRYAMFPLDGEPLIHDFGAPTLSGGALKVIPLFTPPLTVRHVHRLVNAIRVFMRFLRCDIPEKPPHESNKTFQP